jgi:hypothetical protein
VEKSDHRSILQRTSQPRRAGIIHLPIATSQGHGTCFWKARFVYSMRIWLLADSKQEVSLGEFLYTGLRLWDPILDVAK